MLLIIVDNSFTHFYITTYILKMLNYSFVGDNILSLLCLKAKLSSLSASYSEEHKTFCQSFAVWYVCSRLYFCFKVGGALKRCCHIFPSTNQGLATFNSARDDSCEAVCFCCPATVNQTGSNHTHTVRMKHISQTNP